MENEKCVLIPKKEYEELKKPSDELEKKIRDLEYKNRVLEQKVNELENRKPEIVKELEPLKMNISLFDVYVSKRGFGSENRTLYPNYYLDTINFDLTSNLRGQIIRIMRNFSNKLIEERNIEVDNVKEFVLTELADKPWYVRRNVLKKYRTNK